MLYFWGYTTIKATKNDGIEDISTVDFISSEIKHIYTKRTAIISEE
ncbi:hypothetical protein [Helicobacter macacae]|nr:hypothetical protein [Helicobacter macacae]